MSMRDDACQNANAAEAEVDLREFEEVLSNTPGVTCSTKAAILRQLQECEFEATEELVAFAQDYRGRPPKELQGDLISHFSFKPKHALFTRIALTKLLGKEGSSRNSAEREEPWCGSSVSTASMASDDGGSGMMPHLDTPISLGSASAGRRYIRPMHCGGSNAAVPEESVEHSRPLRSVEGGSGAMGYSGRHAMRDGDVMEQPSSRSVGESATPSANKPFVNDMPIMAPVLVPPPPLSPGMSDADMPTSPSRIAAPILLSDPRMCRPPTIPSGEQCAHEASDTGSQSATRPGEDDMGYEMINETSGVPMFENHDSGEPMGIPVVDEPKTETSRGGNVGISEMTMSMGMARLNEQKNMHPVDMGETTSDRAESSITTAPEEDVSTSAGMSKDDDGVVKPVGTYSTPSPRNSLDGIAPHGGATMMGADTGESRDNAPGDQVDRNEYMDGPATDDEQETKRPESAVKNEDDVKSLMDLFSVGRKTAVDALDRHQGNLEMAASWMLDYKLHNRESSQIETDTTSHGHEGMAMQDTPQKQIQEEVVPPENTERESLRDSTQSVRSSVASQPLEPIRNMDNTPSLDLSINDDRRRSDMPTVVDPYSDNLSMSSEGRASDVPTVIETHDTSGDDPMERGSNSPTTSTSSAASSVKGILRDMMDSADSKEVQMKSFEELLKLTHSDSRLSSSILDGGGLPVILQAMSRHSRSIEIQQVGCAILQNIASIDDNARADIASKGGLDVVKNAMRHHLKSTELQMYACGVFSNMALLGSISREFVLDGGGLLITISMKNHFSSLEVQKYACAALLNLSADDASRASIASTCVQPIVSALRRHKTSRELQGYACGALCNLSKNSKSRRVLKMDATLMNTLKEASKRFPRECSDSVEIITSNLKV